MSGKICLQRRFCQGVIEIDQQSVAYGLTIGGFFISVALLLSSRQKKLTPHVSQVEVMDDGSIAIEWGYHNRSNNEMSFEMGESCIHVKKGSAILLAKRPPERFACGKHESVFRTIVVEGTVIEWIIGSTRLEYSVTR